MRARQREALHRSERVADRVERAIHVWWRQLVDLLRSAPQLGVGRLYAAVRAHYQRLPGLVRSALRDGLTELWRWGAASARAAVPVNVLRRAYDVTRRRIPGARQSGLGMLGTFESTRQNPRLRVVERLTPALGQSGVLELTEDRSRSDPRDFLFGSGGLTFPSLPDNPSDSLLRKLVLPVPPEHVIRQRVDRLIAPFLASPRPDLVDSTKYAAQLVQSYSQGKSLDEIAEDLLPVAEHVRASARRVARTWGMEVANQSQWEAHEQLGPDVVMGYRLKSALTAETRDWHRDRHDTVYYRVPPPGEKGFSQMPRPPREPADPNERPANAPWIAWNCL